MTITLPPEWEQIVDEKVASGKFSSADAVIQEGLRLLNLEEMRQEIARGVADVDAGRVREFSVEETKKRLRERLADETPS